MINVDDKLKQKEIRSAKSTKQSQFCDNLQMHQTQLTGTRKFSLHIFLLFRAGFCHGWRSVQWTMKGEIGENISKYVDLEMQY